jgi:hypothetical protein
MQREITLNILAEDIRNNSYFTSESCPITRALHRAGYTKLRDSGTIEGKFEEEYINIDIHNEDYKALLKKLFSMYNSKPSRSGNVYGTGEISEPIAIEDFTITIRF